MAASRASAIRFHAVRRSTIASLSTAISTADDLKGQRVLLVNDVVTTGAGMTALAHVVEAGGEIAGAAWFASRSRIDIEKMIHAPGVCVVAA